MWNESLESSLHACIAIILDRFSGCLRPLIASSECSPFVLYVDSCRHHFGGILCQLQPVSEFEVKNENLENSLNRFYLIEYYNKQIPDNSLLCPIAILELESFYLCLRQMCDNGWVRCKSVE